MNKTCLAKVLVNEPFYFSLKTDISAPTPYSDNINRVETKRTRINSSFNNVYGINITNNV